MSERRLLDAVPVDATRFPEDGRTNSAAWVTSSLGRATSISRFGRLLRKLLGTVLILVGSANVDSMPVEEYRLGISDRVRVSIGQWRIVEEVYENWTGLEGEYVVGPDGSLSMALAGSVPAAGRTVQEIAEAIALRVQQKIGAPVPPATSVEISEFRPVYVLGAVANPGEFRYRPEMTVLHAIGMAGGYLRADEGVTDILTAVRDYEIYGLNRWRLIAELSRLDAELADAAQVEMPAELADAPEGEEFLRVEQQILSAQAEAKKSKAAAIVELKNLLSEKIKSLGEEIELRNNQLQLARDELKRQQKLFERKLIITTIVSEYDRRVSDMEAKLLALRVATLMAQQQLNEARRAELDLVNERKRNIVIESREASKSLDEIEVRLEAAKTKIAAAFGSGLEARQDASRPTHRVIRRVEGETTTLIVDELFLMQPGDTLRVVLSDESPEEEASGGGTLGQR